MKLTPEIAKKAIADFHPKAGPRIGEIKGLDLTLKGALDCKYIPEAKSPKDIAGLFDILYQPGR